MIETILVATDGSDDASAAEARWLLASDRFAPDVVGDAGVETREGRITARGFMTVDTEFHNFIAEGSANRFIRGALLTHLRLRQTTQKDFSVPDFRLRQSLREHLEIIDNLERNLFEVAADLMVLHLRRSGIGRPDAVSRAIPPLMRNPKS